MVTPELTFIEPLVFVGNEAAALQSVPLPDCQFDKLDQFPELTAWYCVWLTVYE